MKILLRYGDLMLKGGNKRMFIKTINRHINRKFRDTNVKIDKRHDRLYIDFPEQDLPLVEKLINEIPGIASYSIMYYSALDNDSILKSALHALNETLEDNREYTFKVETKRSNKRFPYLSLDFTKLIAPLILEATTKELRVQVKHPEVTLTIDVRDDGAYIHINNKRAMGGFPAGIAGKGLLMMSGGIDSPVAAYLMVKQGVNVEMIHFESSPMTPLESINKVIDLAKKLSVFYAGGSVALHLVPFTEIHKSILDKVEDSYSITVMRRMMYRIAEDFANNKKIDILINGESVGQVASQTLSSIKVVEDVTKLPVIRPLATYDKRDIITIARQIDTYDISVRPFNDCCSIYVPKNPVINPTVNKALGQEQYFDYETQIETALTNIQTLYIDKDTNIDLANHGFDLAEALKNMGLYND